MLVSNGKTTRNISNSQLEEYKSLGYSEVKPKEKPKDKPKEKPKDKPKEK